MLKKPALGLLFFLAACSNLPDWLGSADKPALKGDRFSVMSEELKITPDQTLASDEVDIPPQLPAAALPQNGNLALSSSISKITTAEAGEAAQEAFRLISKPAQVGDLVVTVDGENKISAFDLATLSMKWQREIKAPQDKENLPSGGVTAENGVIFATTGYGDVVALKQEDGTEIWRTSLNTPIRNAATLSAGKIFVATSDNKTFALDAKTGESLWQHTGASETTSIYGGSSPAVREGVVVATYSSGEVFGIGVENGKELWTELVSISGDKTKVASDINDIVASPVITDGIAYVSSASGNLAAYNTGNGFRIWDSPVGGTSTPWVAGRYIFVVSDNYQLVALNRFDGRIKWVSKLEDISDKKKIVWNGPVMAGDKLLLVGTHGKLLQVNPKNGEIISFADIPKEIYVPPVIINGAIYLLSNEAKLVKVE